MSRTHALGSLLGAACGDAAGAVLEFKYSVSPEEVDHAMSMPGGGIFRVAPGQITDDTEMMICLARGLTIPPCDARKEYKAWIDSGPFDCGSTQGQRAEHGI
jgi:ADP-ribosylglycohydrolase